MKIAIIGGSGFEDRLLSSGLIESIKPTTVETPFGLPSAPLASGRLRNSGVEVVTLKRHGEGHVFPPHRVPSRANIFALKSLGVTHLVATGAVGSLREEIQAGEIVLCDQLIDRTSGAGGRGDERTFFDSAAVHVEFADPCCPVMRAWLLAAGKSAGVKVHATGTYVTIDGPMFSTRAESRMHRALGADVVGMTALPEARLAREAEIAYALVALPTDYDSWKERPAGAEHPGDSLLTEIIANLGRSAQAAAGLIGAALEDVSALDTPSPAHDALRHAVWTKREMIPREEIERLRPIWGRWVNG